MKEIIKQISINPTDSIETALHAIDRGGMGIALIVASEAKIFHGLITDGDVRRALLNGLNMESKVTNIDHPKTVTGSTHMTMDEISNMFSELIKIIPVLDQSKVVVDLAVFDSRVHVPVAEPQFGESELRYVSDCILTGWVSSSGKYVKRFEDDFSQFCTTKYAASSSNGTTALHLCLLALGIGPGDEVLVPSLTFIATANAVTYTGAKPVFIDSEYKTWNIDPSKLEEAINHRTKAIIPVHLYGHPADMEPILAIAKRHNLAVVEDAAEAHGALYKGEKVGSIGDLGMFSFYGNKIITTGEGGMIVSDNHDLIDRIRLIRDHGMDPENRYRHNVLGYNYRLTNIQAALGVAQMERIDKIIEKKRENAALYNKALENIKGVTLPPEAPWARNIFWLYSILVDDDIFGQTAKQLGEKLRDKGIDTRPLFPPVHLQPIYNTEQTLPVCEKISERGISLPSSVNLSEREINLIVKEIKNIQKACVKRKR